MSTARKYTYEGPVMLFDKCIQRCWFGETYAISEKKARSNLAYQYKRDHLKQAATAKVTLPGPIEMVE